MLYSTVIFEFEQVREKSSVIARADRHLRAHELLFRNGSFIFVIIGSIIVVKPMLTKRVSREGVVGCAKLIHVGFCVFVRVRLDLYS